MKGEQGRREEYEANNAKNGNADEEISGRINPIPVMGGGRFCSSLVFFQDI